MDDDDLYRLQVALVLTQSVMLSSESSSQQFLVQNLALHNVSDFAFHEAQDTVPCKYVLALTDGRLQTTAECKTVLKLQPTVYLVFGEYQDPAEQEEPSQPLPGLALHYSSMRATSLPDIPSGACAHGLASWVADALPLQSLFNYLGQGYQVVLAGYGFGGMVAHTLAVRLLLSVRQEVNMAKQLGINLTALDQTEEKVFSFAFCAPLLANGEMATTLQEQSLASRLHTIWRTRDASPHFFTLCSEFATSAEGHLPADGLIPPTATTVPFNLKSPQLQAANDLSGRVSNEVSNRTGRNRGHQRMVCGPMDTSILTTRASVSGAALSNSSPTSTTDLAPAAAATGKPETIPAPARRSEDTRTSSPALLNSSAAAATLAGRLAPPTRRPGVSPQLSNVANAMRATAKAKSAIDKIAAATATSTSASPQRGEQGKSTSGVAAAQPADKSAVGAFVAKGTALSKSCQYAPVGTFWLLDAPPLPKPGAGDSDKPAAGSKGGKGGDAKGAAEVTLKQLVAARVLASRGEWLTDLNPDLYGCWEWSLDELRKELMEAFAWVMFRVAVNVDGNVISREAIIRPSKALMLE